MSKIDYSNDHPKRDEVVRELIFMASGDKSVKVRKLLRSEIDVFRYTQYSILIRPLVYKDSESGLTLNQIKTKYNVPYRVVTYILIDCAKVLG